MHNRIFLYHLDYEVQTLFGLDDPRQIHPRTVYQLAKIITKLAILLCHDSLILPASNYLESDLGFQLLNEMNPHEFADDVLFELVSSSYNLAALLDKKKIEHGEHITREGFHYFDFIDNRTDINLPGLLIKRNGSASVDIHKAWISEEGRSRLAKIIYNKYPNIYRASELEQLIGDIPEKLGGRAYISRYITPLFVKFPKEDKYIDNEINCFITREYIRSFLDEFNAVCISDIPLFNSDLILPNEEKYQHLSFKKYQQLLKSSSYKGDSAWKYIMHCSTENLFMFKHSDCWRRIIEPPITYDSLFDNGGKEMDMQSKVTIGIITALPKEYAAIKKLIPILESKWDRFRNIGDRYEIGKVKSADGKEHFVALAQCGEGNNLAGIRCNNLIRVFPNVKAIIMCGIAGGVPDLVDVENHVRLGDIVVATNVIQNDYGKKNEEGFEEKSVPTKCSPVLLKAVDRIKADEYNDQYLYNDLIEKYATGSFSKPDIATDIIYDENGVPHAHPEDETRTNHPKVHYGCIASSNMVVKSRFARDEQKRKHKALAVEMEGSGIADASNENMVGFIIVRGICDYCDKHKNNAWQNYAAIVASAYTYNILQYLPALEYDL